MQSPVLAMTLIALLSLLAIVASTVAVWLWRRCRDTEVAARRFAEVLEPRLRSLESKIERKRTPALVTENRLARPSARFSLHPKGYRVDHARPATSTGPLTLIAVPDLSDRPSASASASPGFSATSGELNRRFGTVWDLAEVGATAEAISKATGQPIGRVELILNLRRQWLASEGRA